MIRYDAEVVQSGVSVVRCDSGKTDAAKTSHDQCMGIPQAWSVHVLCPDKVGPELARPPGSSLMICDL